MMNSNIDNTNAMLDTVKLTLALIISVMALVGFYFYADQSLLYRVIVLLVAAGISIAIALKTEKGRQLWGYLYDAHIEVRKVVWPTRQETLQTTLIIILVVILIAIILWLLDMFLGWSIGSLMGHRS